MNVYKLKMRFGTESSNEHVATAGDVERTLRAVLGSSLQSEFARLSPPDDKGERAMVCSEKVAHLLSKAEGLEIDSLNLDHIRTQRLHEMKAVQDKPSKVNLAASLYLLARI